MNSDWKDSDPELPPVAIAIEDLTAEALHGVIESFILREGTDYGSSEVSLETKILQVRKQLDRGDALIVFEPSTETVTLLSKIEWRKRQSQ